MFVLKSFRYNYTKNLLVIIGISINILIINLIDIPRISCSKWDCSRRDKFAVILYEMFGYDFLRSQPQKLFRIPKQNFMFK